MREEDFEAPLFFALITSLVRIEFLDECFFVRIRRGGDSGIFIGDGYAIVPAGIFGHVIGWRFDFQGENPAGFFDFSQKREMVFEEEIEKFFLMAPMDF